MALKNSKSQTEILESSRIALQNVETNPVIKPLMESLGYNTAKIDNGKALLETTKTTFNNNQTLEDTRAKAYKVFEDLKQEIETVYSKDRKKAKVIFRNQTLILKELALKGTLPKSYVKWLETVTTFYNVLNTNADILSQVVVVQITQEHVTAVIVQLNELENARGAYIQAKGNAQNATKTKATAFKELEKWMSSFYAIARIALEDEPQLLESLGKLVKS